MSSGKSLGSHACRAETQMRHQGSGLGKPTRNTKQRKRKQARHDLYESQGRLSHKLMLKTRAFGGQTAPTSGRQTNSGCMHPF